MSQDPAPIMCNFLLLVPSHSYKPGWCISGLSCHSNCNWTYRKSSQRGATCHGQFNPKYQSNSNSFSKSLQSHALVEQCSCMIDSSVLRMSIKNYVCLFLPCWITATMSGILCRRQKRSMMKRGETPKILTASCLTLANVLLVLKCQAPILWGGVLRVFFLPLVFLGQV